MQALIYRQYGEPDVLEWVSGWPEPTVGPGDVLVKLAGGSINPKDIMLRQGKMPRLLAREPLPRGTGMDMAGEVVQVGRRVRDVSPGDQVFGMTNRFCGGLLAEYAVLPADEVALAPPKLSLQESAAMPLAALTALQALRDCGNLMQEQRVLINGASGGVGHFAIQIARILGAHVTAVCSKPNHAMARDLGAQELVDYQQTRARQIEAPYDLVFDVFGAGERSDHKQQLGRQGIYVNTIPKLSTIMAEGRARLRLSRRDRLVIVHSNRRDLNQLHTWVEAGTLSPVVDAVYPFKEAALAHRHVESKHTRGKVVLVPEAST